MNESEPSAAANGAKEERRNQKYPKDSTWPLTKNSALLHQTALATSAIYMSFAAATDGVDGREKQCKTPGTKHGIKRRRAYLVERQHRLRYQRKASKAA